MKNKVRLLSVILTLTLLICAFPMTASAADYEPADGDTLDISAYVGGDVITIGAGRSVTLNGNSVPLANVQIICEAEVNLTLQNVIINNSAFTGICPLKFTGVDSRLILESGTASTLTGGASASGISIETSAELTLDNNGTLTVTGGSSGAGLQCPYGATLTVSGEGALNATGGKYGGGAGIGGNSRAACGSITINSGTVNATAGGLRGAKVFYHAIDGGVITISGGTVNSASPTYGGIGGNSNEGSSISITGGTVTATAGPQAVGIGGIGSLGCDVTITGGTVIATSGKVAAIGRNNTSLSGTVTITGGTVIAQGTAGSYGAIDCSYNSTGAVTITGGTVTATSNGRSAGICGSGVNSDINGTAVGTGTVTISGGTVTATGGTTGGPGICGSRAGTGSVTISGGTVYAGGETCDIGSGLEDTEETLSITGSAMVFIKNNNCTATPDTTHANLTYLADTSEVYGVGIAIPDTWTTEFGAYLRPCALSYDVNGGSGAAPDSVTQLYDTAVTLSDDSGLSLENYHFDGWNTASDGTGINYAAGANYTMLANGTLYAKWAADSVAPTIDPVSRNYDLNAPTDITAAITWNGATSVTDAVYSINSDTTIYALDMGDYTVVDNDLIIESSFFEDLSLTSGAALDFVFTFNSGDEAIVTVNVVDGFVPATTYNVIFSSNGSACATKTANAGESLGNDNFPSDPTRSSYTFGGWFTGENGAGAEFTSATSVNATMTVYAKWTYRSGSETRPTPIEKTITVTETSSELFNDATGTITAEANMDSAFSNSVEVKVTDTPEDMASFGFGAVDEVYPFDISLYAKGTDKKTEPAPGYAVTISLPIPENLLDKKDLLSIVHKSDNGVVTEITSRLVHKNGVWYLVFEATEFSPYALLVRNAGIYNESAGVPYYLDASDNKVFVGFAANGKYLAPEGVTVSVMQNGKSFTDITGHWAAGHIGFVTERDIFVGTGGNTFSPDTGMTRGMFATVIGRLYERSYGEIEVSGTHAFTDCNYDEYYEKYVNWASENNIIGGVNEGRFDPDTLITREQMAVVLYRFADFLGVLPNGMDTALSYPDADSISGYAKTAALYCHATSLIDGRIGGVFAPQEAATRAEVTTILQRFVEVVMK